MGRGRREGRKQDDSRWLYAYVQCVLGRRIREADKITFVLYRFRSCMLPLDFAQQTTLALAIALARQINFPVPGVHLPTVAKPPPASRSYEGGFVTALAHKDLDLAVEAARHVDAPLYVGRLAEEIFRKVRGTEDWDARDFSIVYKWLEEKSGAE
jgi:hypothetical protein